MTPKKTADELQGELDHKNLFDSIVAYCDIHFASKNTEKIVFGFVALALTAVVVGLLSLVIKG